MSDDIKRELLWLRQRELEAQLEVVTTLLAELDAGPQVSPEPPEPEPEQPPAPRRMAMCVNGCTTWQEGGLSACPVCSSDAPPLFPAHLQAPVEAEVLVGDLAAVAPGRKAVTLETVRDYVVTRRAGPRFSTAAVADHFSCSQDTVREHLEHLASLGTLKREMSFSSRGRWWSCPEIEDEGPTHHPRQPLRVPGVGADRTGNGATVAGTGKPIGRSGKPGLDRKHAQTKRVAD